MPEFLEAIFPGIAAMHNIHPLLVHFPIGLLSTFFAAELLGFLTGSTGLRAAASWMLYFGTLGAVAAAGAGVWAASTVPHGPEVHSIVTTHMSLMLTVVGLSVFLSLWRLIYGSSFTAFTRLVHLGVAFVTVVVMAIGADKGGLMVYKYGVGTQVSEAAGEDHTHGLIPGMEDGHEHDEADTEEEVEAPDEAPDHEHPGGEVPGHTH